MFTFTFSSDAKRQPTIDFLENARIKNYITCYVYKKSGLLSRERLLEKNQFQVFLTHATIGVDAMFPDRFFNCLVSRPLSSNNAYYEIRARCNTHLLSGLPFLVELDMAVDAEIRSITLSLHQGTSTAIGSEEEDHGLVSRYVHEVQRPQHVPEGHFRTRESARRLAQGRRAWVIEWICPGQHSQMKLPFSPTFYCKTREGNIERGLSLKVEVELSNAPVKLLAMMHNLQYYPDWIDTRPDQTISLYRERSIANAESFQESPRLGGRRISESVADRRGSVISTRSQHLNYSNSQGPSMRSSPLLSPGVSIKSSDYFGDQAGVTRARLNPGMIDAKLSYGSYNPQAIQMLARQDSTRSVSSNQMGRHLGGNPLSRNTSGKARPEHITLPPASIRSSMSSAFENLNMRNSVTNSLSSPTKRDFDEINPTVHGLPTPPPSQPLPPAPTATQETMPMIYNPFAGTAHASASNLSDDGASIRARQKKVNKQARPAMILGVSQDTIQTHEEADRVRAEEQRQRSLQEFAPTPLRNAYSANINRATGKPAENLSINNAAGAAATADRDSGYSDMSYAPTSPLAGSGKPHFGSAAPMNTSGYGKRLTPHQSPRPSSSDADETVQIMLG